MRTYLNDNEYVTIETKKDFESIIKELEFNIGKCDDPEIADRIKMLNIEAISWACSHNFNNFCVYAFELKPDTIVYYLDDGDELVLIAEEK